jgi:hypothetical protein
MITNEQVQTVTEKIENNKYTSYFFLPDFDKPSGGVKLTYDHVRCMNQQGFNATIIHQKKDYVPEWLGDYYEKDEKTGHFEDAPTIYLDEDKLPINMEDFFFIPEGFPQVMESLAKQNAPCKKIVFCQNWYYVLNALPPGVFWQTYGINDCMSVSNVQSDYLKMIMPGLKVKNVIGHIPDDLFTPPENLEDKQLQIAFIGSRFDGGAKSHNVIKTFYALFPYFRFIKFAEVKGLNKDDYAKLLRDSTFYVHFDEYSSWGTAPIEAWLSKCLMAGWDGVGGKEFMSTENMWCVPNGDIFRLALAMGNMVETYIMDDVPDSMYENMQIATMNYSREAEKDSIVKAHTEYREERLEELKRLEAMAPTEEEVKENEE